MTFSIYIVAFVLILTIVLTRRPAAGLFIEAVGINPTAARFAGINARGILFWVYAFSGLCARISGLIVCSTVMSADGNHAGNLFELDAILAVVLGATSLNGYVVSINTIPISDPFFQAMAQTPLNIIEKNFISPSAIIAIVVVVAGGVFTFYTLSGYALDGKGLELDSIATVVIGGTLLTGGVGNILGTLLGVLVYGTIQVLITFQGTLNSWWTRIVIGFLVFAFCLLQRLFERRKVTRLSSSAVAAKAG